jgi:RNA polymerase sigma-70 factor (ECF subfamily)
MRAGASREGKTIMKEKVTEQPEFEWNESEAIKRAQCGDAAAFEYLYKSHSKRVYGICMRMLKNAADAEDLTQHVFLRLFRKIGSFRGEARLSTWLHRVTVNAVLMHLRRKKPTEAYVEGWDETTGTNGYAPIHVDAGKNSSLGVIDAVKLVRAIRHLPASCRRFFLLHHVMGYRHSEIARLVGCSIACSKSQVHRACRRLQTLLVGEARGQEHVSAA